VREIDAVDYRHINFHRTCITVARGTFAVRLQRWQRVERCVIPDGLYGGLIVALCAEEITEGARVEVPQGMNEAIKQIADAIETF
jgi:hypothetical protein